MSRSGTGRDRDPSDGGGHDDHSSSFLDGRDFDVTTSAGGGGLGGRDALELMAAQLQRQQQYGGGGGLHGNSSLAAALAAAGLGTGAGGGGFGGSNSAASAVAAYYAAAAAASGASTNPFFNAHQLAAAQQLQQQQHQAAAALAARRSLGLFSDAATAASYLNNPYAAAAAAAGLVGSGVAGSLSAELYAQELLHRQQQQQAAAAAAAAAAAHQEAAAVAAHYKNPHATAAHELAAHLEAGSRSKAASAARAGTANSRNKSAENSRPYSSSRQMTGAAVEDQRAAAVEMELEARMMRHRYGLEIPTSGGIATIGAGTTTGSSLHPTVLSSSDMNADLLRLLQHQQPDRPFSSAHLYDPTAAAAGLHIAGHHRDREQGEHKPRTIEVLQSSDTPSPGSHHYRGIRDHANRAPDHPFYMKKKYDSDSSSLSLDLGNDKKQNKHSTEHSAAVHASERLYSMKAEQGEMTKEGGPASFTSGHTTKRRKSSKRSKRDNMPEISPASKEPWATTFTPLALATDQYWLTELWCFLRSEFIEAFGAVEEDLELPLNGRTKPSLIGQVGLRCAWCKDKPFNSREQLSLICPSTIAGIYNGAYQMLRMHFDLCRYIPEEMKKKVTLLQSATPRGGRNDYWVMSAKRLGLIETPYGLFFESDPHKCRKEVEEEELAKLNSSDNAITLKSTHDPSSPETGKPGSAHKSGGELTEKSPAVESVPENLPLAPNVETQQPVVYPKDANLVSRLLFVAFDNLHLTKLQEADKIGCYRMRPTGYPGVACNHCVGISGNGRYFPPTEQSLSQTTTTQTIVNHLKTCVRCPAETRTLLRQLITIDPKKLPKEQKPIHGGRKIFFKRVWCRIQGKEEPGSDNEVYHEKKKIKTHLRRQVAEEILQEEQKKKQQQQEEEAKKSSMIVKSEKKDETAEALMIGDATHKAAREVSKEAPKTTFDDEQDSADNKMRFVQMYDEMSTSTDGYHSDKDDEEEEKMESTSDVKKSSNAGSSPPLPTTPTSEFNRLNALLKSSKAIATSSSETVEAPSGTKEDHAQESDLDDDFSTTETSSSALMEMMEKDGAQGDATTKMFYHGWTKLSTDDDTSFLSDLVSFCRSECFEAFTVPNWLHAEDMDDAGGPMRQIALVPGQVGIRCMDCAKNLAAKDRPDSHAAYPTSLKDVQGILSDLIKRHLSKCPCMSKDKEHTLKALRGYGYKKAPQEIVNQFWIDGLMELGMEDWPSDAPNAVEDNLPGTVRFIRNPFIPSPASLLLNAQDTTQDESHLMAISVVRKNILRAKQEAEEKLRAKDRSLSNASDIAAGHEQQIIDTSASLLANEHNAPAPSEAPMEDKHETPVVSNRDPDGFLLSSWVKPGDRFLATDFLYFLLYCTLPCKSKHKLAIPSGEGGTQNPKSGIAAASEEPQSEDQPPPLYGLECRWCAPNRQKTISRKGYKRARGATAGQKIIQGSKYKSSCGGCQNPNNSKVFGDMTVPNLQQHMLKDCPLCPKPVRASLRFLLHRHNVQLREKRMKGGKKRAFIDEMWERLQKCGSKFNNDSTGDSNLVESMNFLTDVLAHLDSEKKHKGRNESDAQNKNDKQQELSTTQNVQSIDTGRAKKKKRKKSGDFEEGHRKKKKKKKKKSKHSERTRSRDGASQANEEAPPLLMPYEIHSSEFKPSGAQGHTMEQKVKDEGKDNGLVAV